jgi:hypothetical protein
MKVEIKRIIHPRHMETIVIKRALMRSICLTEKCVARILSNDLSEISIKNILLFKLNPTIKGINNMRFE